MINSRTETPMTTAKAFRTSARAGLMLAVALGLGMLRCGDFPEDGFGHQHAFRRAGDLVGGNGQGGVGAMLDQPPGLVEAAALFDKVAADASAPEAMRNIATIRSVAARYDTMKPADVVAKLKPLATPGNAWFGPAGEMVAMAYLDQGNQAEAGALFAAIARDKDISESLKARSRQMAGLLGVDAIDDVDTVIAQTNPVAPAGAE